MMRAGNLIIDGTNTYTYDAENRLITAGGVTYSYDGDGNRVMKSNGTIYWRGSDGETLAESNLSGTISEEYVYINGKREVRIDRPSGAVHLYFTDLVGSTTLITDVNGTPQEQSDYYPFGGEIPISGTDPNHYKFTGKEYDSESGLDNFGARYYASTMGRFMVPDKPFNDQASGDPQSWNMYSYVRNNPLKNTDPTGDACVQGSDGKWRDDNSGGESCAQVDVNNATTGPSVIVRATADDVSYQLAHNVANLTTPSDLSEVGVKGMLWADAARGVWELGGLGLSWATAGRAGAEMIQGAYGSVSRAALEAAASGGGDTVRLVCTIDGAPAAGKALSTAAGEGADALANAAGGGTKYVGNVPKALIQMMERAGLVERSTTSMGNAVATEVKFSPQATQFVIQFFRAVH